MGSGSFPTFGYRDLSGSFGLEANEITREFYVQDWDGLQVLLNQLLGTPGGDLDDNGDFSPHRFPYPFDGFYCTDVKFVAIKDGAIQGSMYTAVTGEDGGDLMKMLDSLENLNDAGGLKVIATYRPMDAAVTAEEGFDFSGQVMSLISNAWAQDPAWAMQWEVSGPASNLKGMTKIIPKIELMQKNVYRSSAPIGDNDLTYLIGSTNRAPFTFMQASQADQQTWDPETLLLLAMPTLRRWRWDGRPMWEVSLRIAANTFQDTLADGTQDFVTWNRLYNIYSQNGPCWERLLLTPDVDDSGLPVPGTGDPMYQLMDWDPLYQLFDGQGTTPP